MEGALLLSNPGSRRLQATSGTASEQRAIDLTATSQDYYELTTFFQSLGVHIDSFSAMDAHMSKDDALERIERFFNTGLHVHVLCVMAHGRASDGAWVFNEGCVTFEDIMMLWVESGHLLDVTCKLFVLSDSCYSGWLVCKARCLGWDNVFVQAACGFDRRTLDAFDHTFTHLWLRWQNDANFKLSGSMLKLRKPCAVAQSQPLKLQSKRIELIGVLQTTQASRQWQKYLQGLAKVPSGLRERIKVDASLLSASEVDNWAVHKWRFGRVLAAINAQPVHIHQKPEQQLIHGKVNAAFLQVRFLIAEGQYDEARSYQERVLGSFFLQDDDVADMRRDLKLVFRAQWHFQHYGTGDLDKSLAHLQVCLDEVRAKKEQLPFHASIESLILAWMGVTWRSMARRCHWKVEGLKGLEALSNARTCLQVMLSTGSLIRKSDAIAAAELFGLGCWLEDAAELGQLGMASEWLRMHRPVQDLQASTNTETLQNSKACAFRWAKSAVEAAMSRSCVAQWDDGFVTAMLTICKLQLAMAPTVERLAEIEHMLSNVPPELVQSMGVRNEIKRRLYLVQACLRRLDLSWPSGWKQIELAYEHIGWLRQSVGSRRELDALQIAIRQIDRFQARMLIACIFSTYKERNDEQSCPT